MLLCRFFFSFLHVDKQAKAPQNSDLIWFLDTSEFSLAWMNGSGLIHYKSVIFLWNIDTGLNFQMHRKNSQWVNLCTCLIANIIKASWFSSISIGILHKNMLHLSQPFPLLSATESPKISYLPVLPRNRQQNPLAVSCWWRFNSSSLTSVLV